MTSYISRPLLATAGSLDGSRTPISASAFKKRSIAFLTRSPSPGVSSKALSTTEGPPSSLLTSWMNAIQESSPYPFRAPALVIYSLSPSLIALSSIQASIAAFQVGRLSMSMTSGYSLLASAIWSPSPVSGGAVPTALDPPPGADCSSAPDPPTSAGFSSLCASAIVVACVEL